MTRKETFQENRLRIRKLLYKKFGRTYNELELFLLNRFPNSHDTYYDEWALRFEKPNHIAYMDEESFQIWLSVISLMRDIPKTIPIKGDFE